MTPLARAWSDAAADLGFAFVTPFEFEGNDGRRYRCSGHLPHIGASMGALIISRDDPDFERLFEAIEGLGYYTSGLNPLYYEAYDRERFLETVRDWRWFGSEAERPACF